MFTKVKKLLSAVLILSALYTIGYISAGAGSSLSITKQPTDMTVYAGTSVSLSVKASGSTALKYQWYSSKTDSSSGGFKIANGTGSSYSPLTSKAGTTYYYCLVYTSGAEALSVTSSAAAVSVKALPYFTEQSTGMTAYVGDSVILSVKAIGSGTLSYQWYSILENSPNSAVPIANATDMKYTASTAEAGTAYYYCVVTNTDNTMTGTKTASVTSGLIKVAVNPVSTTIPTITSQPSSVTVYAGSTVRLAVSAVGSGTITYQWYRNTKNSTSGSTAIYDGSNASYAVPTGTTGTVYYYCVVTNTTSAGVYTSVSAIAACTVRAATVITAQPVGTTAFAGDSVTLSIAAEGSGTLTYQWYSNTVKRMAGSVKLSDAVGSSYSPYTLTTGTTYYYCVVTNTDSTVTGAKTNSVTSDIVQVAVIVDKAAPAVITAQTSSRSVYTGSTVILKMTATGLGTLTYQWYSSAEDSTADGTAISGATRAEYTVPTSSAGTAYYYCVVTNTTVTTAGPKALTTVSGSIRVTCIALPVITRQPVGITAYTGDSVTLSVAAAGSGTLSYQWFKNSKNSVAGSSKIAGAVNSSYTLPLKATGISYYYCVVTNTDSTITGTKTAAVTSVAAAVTVKSANAAAPAITQNPANATIVMGSSVSLSVKATGTAALSYQWYCNTKNSVKGGVVINGATGETYTVMPAAAGTFYYFCVVTNTDSLVPGIKTVTATSKIAAVTVKALIPVIKQQPVPSTVVYKGNRVILSVTAVGSGTLSYQWYSNTENGSAGGTAITGATGLKYTFSAESEGTRYYYCVVTNSVKQAAATKADTAVSTVAAVTVKALPVIIRQPVGTTAYIGDTVTLSVSASGSGTLTYQWFKSGGSIIKGATKSSYSFTAKTTGTSNFYCIVTNTDNSITGKKTAVITSSIAKVTVVKS